MNNERAAGKAPLYKVGGLRADAPARPRKSRSVVFECHDLINAALVALGVGKPGAEPGVDDLEREHLARDAGADGHHVGRYVRVSGGQTSGRRAARSGFP